MVTDEVTAELDRLSQYFRHRLGRSDRFSKQFTRQPLVHSLPRRSALSHMFDKVTRLFVMIVPVTLALATTSSAGGVQSFVCDTIRPGETASAVARRVTGRASSQHQRWFRIVDRARSRVVPKAEYNRILAGWQACIPAPRVAARVSSSAYAIDTIAQNETTRPLASPPKIAARQPLSRGAAVARAGAVA